MVFVLLILVTFILPKIVRNTSDNQLVNTDTAWIAALKKLEVRESQSDDQKNYKREDENKNFAYQYDRTVDKSPAAATLFYFDPNTVDQQGWEKLGLKDKTIHTIQNYLSKGGHFNKAEDLKKIYGLPSKDYIRLEPFVKIETITTHEKPAEFVKKENEPMSFSYKTIDINTADTSAFISLPGIGGKLATRIVTFREKLGGFYSINQIGETYGLPDSSFQRIKQYLNPGNAVVKKININTATLDELKVHPYIKYSVANPIVSYRNEHGPFSKLEDIRKVMAVTDDIYKKILPYLTVSD